MRQVKKREKERELEEKVGYPAYPDIDKELDRYDYNWEVGEYGTPERTIGGKIRKRDRAD